MIIYFLRHASAGKSLLNPKKDERRPLDEEGILQSRYVGRMLANLDVQVDQIITSPLKRARQTASLVANELAFESALQADDALRPDAELEQFQSMLARHRNYDAIIVEMNGRTGTLDWLVTPKIARTLQASLKTSSRPKTSRK